MSRLTPSERLQRQRDWVIAELDKANTKPNCEEQAPPQLMVGLKALVYGMYAIAEEVANLREDK